MNTSQPVSSQLSSVTFSHLSSSAIRALSAKQITNPVTFDTLLNPTPGGLYTPELGQFGDQNCTTCGLRTPQCPGHCGHIELPVPVYHVTFMDQVLRLLRGTCVYCSRLKISRAEANQILCKLRLVKLGLLKEAKDIDDIRLNAASIKARADQSDDGSDEEGNDADTRDLIEKRLRFVEKAITYAREEGRISMQKTEATSNARREIVQDFMAAITKSKKCRNCQGIGHKYRKDRYVKIFRKPLSEKEKVMMVQAGLAAKEAVVEVSKRRKVEAGRKRKRDAEQSDEGVADMGASSGEEEAGEGVESSEEEPEIVGGDNTMLDMTAGQGKTKNKQKVEPQEEYLNPARVNATLTQMFDREREILSYIYGNGDKHNEELSADMFFTWTILVPPTRFRPEARTGADEIAEAQENSLYKNIINACTTLSEIQREISTKSPSARGRIRSYADLENTWVSLQDAVNSLIDRDRNPIQGAAGKRNADGVKQKLEKKEGMFRKYMMGKRVNFAARTVISPDPNIETNEIGVPPVFAVKLTYPEPVTTWNVEELQEAVKNGAHLWPGAVSVEDEEGKITSLDRKTPDERLVIANQLLAPTLLLDGVRGTRPKKVHRHLNNGDIVIMNRQPTLHKPSMMCHRARVLPGEKTLRMHYANCNTYNADFDGDEMNLHFPQNELARAEALSVADTDHQYLSATAGNPLRGLIQDHISMSLWLTNRDTFFDRSEYMQLLYAAIRPESGHAMTGRIVTVPPAVMKPKALWTGKQVVTTVLLNVKPTSHQGLTMEGKSTTDKLLWGEAGKEEGAVVIQDGYLCQGVLDKKQIGPSSGGLINGIYEAYGHVVAGRLLSVLGRLLTRMLTTRAFSCGVEDLILTREGEGKRRNALAGAADVGLEVAKKYVGLEDHPKTTNESSELRKRLEDVLRDDGKQAALDQLTSAANSKLTSAAQKACMPSGLVKPFPRNQMQAMTSSGAKGSSVNANQISCNLGQQVLEGRRVPVMPSGKTLPCFKPFETSVRAGGYIVDRFLTGVRPQEYFFHAMAGREGLIDTAVKTSRSGYLQRCLIKGMEGLRVEHDTSVRDVTDGSMVQFLYGEDGLDVAKARYLYDFKFEAENHLSLFQNLNVRDEFGRLMSEEAAAHNKSAEKKYRKTQELGVSTPALAVFPPATMAGSTSERLLRESRAYVDADKDGIIKDKKRPDGIVSKKNFQAIIDLRYLKSVVEAGEAVGVIAGQSVGEPSTQMTLNTFHLAGHSAKNVTLGIPRLREIVMTAAKELATPMMTLRLNEELGVEEARQFAKGISRLSLGEIVDRVVVEEVVGKGDAYGEARKYEVKLELFPREEYGKEYAITVDDVVSTIELRFLPVLQTLARKEIKKRGDEKSLKAEIGKSVGRIEEASGRRDAEREGGDDDSDGEGDDDATRDKSKNNRMQAGYEAQEDEEETAIARRNQREEVEVDDEDEAYGGSPRGSPAPTEQGGTQDTIKSAASDRENRIKGDRKTNDVTRFEFDDTKGDFCSFTLEYDASAAKILMLHLVEAAAKSALIQSVDGITSCVLDEEATKKASGIPHLIASGVNIPAMWEYQHIIHPHHLYTNSIHHTLMHYGVEAARSAIVRELQGVFSGHAISVDPRHLTLIADYMTRSGGYQAFSRMGYRGNTSPFMKMSFETTVGFLRDAVLNGEGEGLRGPSSRIVVGGLGPHGTGGFDVLNRVGEGLVEETQ